VDAALIAAAESDLSRRGAGRRSAQSLQRIAVEDSRLGVPLIFGFDTIHGFRTTFPIPLGLSCTWIRNSSSGSRPSPRPSQPPPALTGSSPRWWTLHAIRAGGASRKAPGRPVAGRLMAAAAVRGFQGSDFGQTDRVAACLKHYVGYGAAEGGRDYNTTEIGLPTLRNVYLLRSRRLDAAPPP